jgi:hypothetical protein
MVDPFFRLAEQGGFFTIMAVVGTVSLVAIWRLVVRPALESVTGITSSVREITVANQETAQVLSSMVNELREYLPEKKERR